MSVISFVIDERGKKTAAVIDLRRHGQPWEDFYDALVAASRESEPRETLEQVKRRLMRRSRGANNGVGVEADDHPPFRMDSRATRSISGR